MIDFTDVLLLCLYNHDCLFPDRCDEMAQRKVEPINETCHSCLIFNWPRFLCTILLCQKSFLKVSSKWLLKNKSDNGKLLLGKTYSGERFRAILALLFKNFIMSIQGKKPPFTRAMFMFRSEFCEQCLKGSSKEHSCEII